MSVNRETIEIPVSGLGPLNQLESTLLRAQGAADALSDAVGRVGGSLESATGRFTQTAQIERALRRTRRVAQQSLVDPRARRAMGSAGVRRRQADVENMSAEISELRERRRQERLDIAERRRRVANLSRRSAQRRQEAQAADRRLQAQERRILEINDQMTGQVSEARLGSRTERSRTLIRRRQLDAQRLRHLLDVAVGKRAQVVASDDFAIRDQEQLVSEQQIAPGAAIVFSCFDDFLDREGCRLEATELSHLFNDGFAARVDVGAGAARTQKEPAGQADAGEERDELKGCGRAHCHRGCVSVVS